MRRTVSLWDSTVGRKIVMAVSGAILILFVLFHMLGNLKVYQGPAAFNHYAEGLRTFGAPFFGNSQLLWLLRIGLIIAVLVHIVAAWQLTRRANAARAVGYKRWDGDLVFSYASRTMRWGGVIILLFVIYHLLHLTFGSVHPDFVTGDAYHNFITGFRSWPVALGYVAAMIPLGFHLYHGFWSMLQSLGANNEKYNHLRRPIAAILALLIVLANISFPVAVLTGILR